MDKKWLVNKLEERRKELVEWQRNYQAQTNRIREIERRILQIQGAILFIKGELDKLEKKRRG